jgi:hypothetical protein
VGLDISWKTSSLLLNPSETELFLTSQWFHQIRGDHGLRVVLLTDSLKLNGVTKGLSLSLNGHIVNTVCNFDYWAVHHIKLRLIP